MIELSDEDRDVLEAMLRKRTAEARFVLRARIVLAAADGEENLSVELLEVAPNGDQVTQAILRGRHERFD